jgi:transposase
MCRNQSTSGIYMSNENYLFDLPKHTENDKTPDSSIAKPRLKVAIRNQVEIMTKSIDECLPDDHKVRDVWDYVKQLDLSQILGKIKSVESNPGAPAIDPHILMALWLYAFIEGIISAKMINRYCSEHIAFKWLCGGVSVNEHTISDFRTKHGDAFDDLLTQSIGVMSHQGLVQIGRIAQDGMKVEAHAGKSSFRRGKTLKKHLKEAENYVKTLKKELVENPGAISAKQAAAKKRAAEVKVQKTKQALRELEILQEQKRAAAKKKGRSFTEEDKQNVRASKTDPEARVMKMPNSGFAPAYNVQFATDTASKLILGVTAVQAGHDYGQLNPMKKQVEKRLGHAIPEILADPGFLEYEDVNEVSQTSRVYIPCDTVKEDNKRFESVREMKKLMETAEAKAIYKERAATAEFVNARVRTRGLTQLLVSGLAKVQVVATLFAIGQNMLVWMSKS